MAKRTMSGPRYAKRVFTYLHNVVGHYFPGRFLLLYPAYLYMVAYHVTQWICSDSIKHRTLGQRVWAVTGLYVTLIPLWFVWLGEWGYLRIRDGEPRRRPALAPLSGASDLGHQASARATHARPEARGPRPSAVELAPDLTEIG